jgi:hypothetical protein
MSDLRYAARMRANVPDFAAVVSEKNASYTNRIIQLRDGWTINKPS